MGLPIDLVRRVKSKIYQPSYYTTGITDVIKRTIADTVVLLLVTEYRTGETSLKENATPISGWKETISEAQTHYADKMYYGGRCIAMARMMSSVPGDNQVVRRILTDVMGTSGPIGEKTLDLWYDVTRAVFESPDIRGPVSYDGFSVECQNIELPSAARWDLEAFLHAIPNVKSLTQPYHKDQPKSRLRVSYKPLRSLDGEYPAVEKNKVSEKYLVSLDEKLDDLDFTYGKLSNFPYIPKKHRLQLRHLRNTVTDVWEKMRALTYDDISMYKDLDEEEFEDAFRQYQDGLDEGERSYYSAFKKFMEDKAMDCEMDFRNSTSGSLETSPDEVLGEGSVEGGLEECEELCQSNERCRAVGYGGSVPNQCYIYYRSTNTANILSPGEMPSLKVYDRICEPKG